MKYIAIVCLLLSGCASPGFRSADCTEDEYQGHKVLVCNDLAVNHNCHKWTERAERDGGVVAKTDCGDKKVCDITFAACAHVAYLDLPAYIVIGRSYDSDEVRAHEACHLEGHAPPYCARRYPCLGE